MSHNQENNIVDLKAITVPSWQQAFRDFHTEAIAELLQNTENKNNSRLKHFIMGQFYEHGLFKFEQNIEKAIECYKQGAKLSDPLCCYRLAEAYSHQENPLKIVPDFEDNLYYQAMTMCFTQLYYGVSLFNCEGWFQNYLQIDPEINTLNRVVRQNVKDRTQYAIEFQNEYSVQNLIKLLLTMRTHNVDLNSKDSVESEKIRVQEIYDKIVEFLSQSIHKRAEDQQNTSSFAYETLLYLFATESFNSDKRVDSCLQILMQYPRFLVSATENLYQEIEIISLSQLDNMFFSHMRFVLIEIHNISKMLRNLEKESDKQDYQRLLQVLEKTFEAVYRFKQEGKIKEQGDIIFITRHYAELISKKDTKEGIEKAIQIQQQELDLQNQGDEQLAFCYYKLGSFYRKILQSKNIKSDNAYQQPEILLNGEKNNEEDFQNQLSEKMKKYFEKAEALYNSRVKNINEQPLSKMLSTFYLGRIHQKIKSNNNVAYRYFFKVLQIYNQNLKLLSNCRTLQFEIAYLKSLKRLNGIQQTDPNLYLQNYITLNNQSTNQNTFSNTQNIYLNDTNSLFINKSDQNNSIHSNLHDTQSINKRNANQQQIDIYQSSIYQGARMMAPCGTLQTMGSYRAMNHMQNVKDDQNFASGLAKAFQREYVFEIPAKEIRIKSMMRKGQFGSVHTIMYKDELYAAKQIQFVPRSFYDKLLEELKSNLEVVHPALFPILAVTKWYSNKEHRTSKDPINILLIMDLKKSNLEQVLSENLVLSQSIAFRIASQVCSGICALHDHDIIHTNIKLKNILIDSNFNAFITDWGISHLFSNLIDRNLDEFTTSLAFAAPEIQTQSISLERGSISGKSQFQENISSNFNQNITAYFSSNGENSNPNKENMFEENVVRTSRISNFSKESDVWSFGVVLLCLFFDFYPNEKSIKDINLYNGVTILNCNPKLQQIYSLIQDMLKIQPSQRISISQVQQRLQQMQLFFDSGNNYEN
ncbi:hypothetical protein ABPG72_000189 [Tetrahymena utriculariae]